MDVSQLKRYMLNDKAIRQCYGGVVPKNHLPILLRKKPLLYIVNTDASYEQGEHWTVIWFDKKTINEYFDPLGYAPKEQEIENYLIWHGNSYQYNNKRIQGPFSNKCGQFCLFYCYYKARGWTMEEILHRFSDDNFLLNDIIVQTFYEHTK